MELTQENFVQMGLHQVDEATPIELTIDSKGVAEKTYGPKSKHLPEVADLLTTLAEKFPDALTDPQFQNWEMIGFTKKDGVNYFEDTISLVIRATPDEALVRKFALPGELKSYDPTSQFLDYYTIKFLLDSKSKVLKVYDANFLLYPLPALPEGTRLHIIMGIGRHFGDSRVTLLRDVYFLHRKPHKMKEFCEEYGIPYPDDSSVEPSNLNYGYGLVYDSVNLMPVKLKRYHFPHDPNLVLAQNK